MILPAMKSFPSAAATDLDLHYSASFLSFLRPVDFPWPHDVK